MPNAIYSDAALQTANDIARALMTGFGHLKLPFTFATADAAVLYTIPSTLGRVQLKKLWWEVTTSFTGGSSSAIGVSSSNASYSTNGDLLGGSAGDVAATLVSTGALHKGGLLGTKFQGTLVSTTVTQSPVVVLVGGDTLKFNRITSIFTAGVGFVHADYALID